MSKRNNGTFKISYILVVVLVILVLLLAVSFIAKFTNNFTSDFAAFYVEHDGKTITSDRGGFNFDKDTEYRIKVGYPLGVFNKEKLSYNVKVMPNVTDETDFEFTDGTEAYKYSDITDLTEQFKIQQYDDYFTLTADKLLNEIIENVYGDTLTGVPSVNFKQDYLKLVISSVDSSACINLTFNVSIPVEGVQPDYEHIIAG